MQKNIRALLDRAFGKGSLSRDGVNYALHCPACNDSRKEKKKLTVRLDDARYHCWVCETKGSNVKFLIKKHRPDLIDPSDKINLNKRNVIEETDEILVKLPGDFVFLGNENIKDPDIIATKKYLLRRGLKKSDIFRWRMLATSKGSFRRKAIIPSFDEDGNLNYYVARSIDGSGPYKYKNAKISKKKIIFNEIDINWKLPVVLVEGVFDAINCPENTIPILGSSLTNNSKLFQKILSNQTPVTVALDPDLKMKAFKIAKLLKSAGCEVQIIFAPNKKDFGDLSKGDVIEILSKSVPYEDFARITHKIRSIRSGTIL